MEELTKAMEILDKISFFGGQRAGRELWNDKTREVQDEDIASFNRDIEWLRDFICRMDAGWIPVEERDHLPEAGEHVLVSIGTGFNPEKAFLSEDGHWTMLHAPQGYNDITDMVDAWRPLPEPYKPKQPETCKYTGGSCCWPIDKCRDCPNNPERSEKMTNREAHERDCNELEQYREIGTVEDCREAREKQKPKKIIRIVGRYPYKCPTCNGKLEIGYRHCIICGQLLRYPYENLEEMEDE